MKQQTQNKIRLVVQALVAMVLASIINTYIWRLTDGVGLVLACVFFFFGAWLGFLFNPIRRQNFVDVWAPQRELMQASNQKLPDVPSINSGSILYIALVLEELAETVGGITRAMRGSYLRGTQGPLVKRLQFMQISLEAQSNDLRQEIARSPSFNGTIVMSTDVEEILDGVTDLAVVVAGLGLSLGMPVAEAYTEVSRSNSSKINPETGTIDKTSDGKWIKGRNYTKPDLRAIIKI